MFNLDHFILGRLEILKAKKNSKYNEELMPPLPISDDDILTDSYHGRFLVIDASKIGKIRY